MKDSIGCPITLGEYNKKTLGCPCTLGKYKYLYENEILREDGFDYYADDIFYVRQNELWKSLTDDSKRSIVNLISSTPGDHNIFADHFELLYLITLRKFIVLCKEHPEKDFVIPTYLIVKKMDEIE